MKLTPPKVVADKAATETLQQSIIPHGLESSEAYKQSYSALITRFNLSPEQAKSFLSVVQ